MDGASRYDFYGNPPKTKADLREWLTTWLEPTPNPRPIEQNGLQFIEESGFRRAFYSHSIIRNTATNEYGWWVAATDDGNEANTFPKEWFPTQEALLNHVIDYYYNTWKLGEVSS